MHKMQIRHIVVRGQNKLIILNIITIWRGAMPLAKIEVCVLCLETLGVPVDIILV